MAYFDNIIKDILYPVKNYTAFINLFQNLASKFCDNAYIYYQTLDADG